MVRKKSETVKREDDKRSCGVIMPIAEIDGRDEAHWTEVYDIIRTSAAEAGMDARLVSEAEHIGVIQKQIVKNLYSNDIIICDVSARNPNVMLELGIRLAFNKPVIVIKDDKTPYSFDTSPIQHLSYPRTLRHKQIQNFQEELAEKLRAILDGKVGQSFLDSFGDFKVAQIDVQQAPADEVILDELRLLRREIAAIRSSSQGPSGLSLFDRLDPRSDRSQSVGFIIVDDELKKEDRIDDLHRFVESMSFKSPVESIYLDHDNDIAIRFSHPIPREAITDYTNVIERQLEALS